MPFIRATMMAPIVLMSTMTTAVTAGVRLMVMPSRLHGVEGITF